MPTLAATNLTLSFGTRTILDGVSLSIDPGQKIGIVGRNGQGKSTLLKILAGIQKQDTGEVSLQKGCRAGYLHQDPILDPDETLRGAAESAFERLHALHRHLDEIYEKMATAQGDELDKLMKLQERVERDMEAAGGYAVDHKIEATLHGLGFTDAQFNIPVRGLSGGQKGRLALAKLLLEEPDVLLLDEPTNHLDIDGRLWLEGFLKDFKGAVFLISHDRYLLDNVVERIIEVEQGRLIDYPGNYEAFREIRAQRRLTQHRAYEKQQDFWKKEEEYIRRFKAGQRARQAMGRLAKLERNKEQNALERVSEHNTFRLQLPKAPRSGDMVLTGRAVSKSYPAEDGSVKVLFRDLEVSVTRGERWGIIGPNGAGKSTLVRTLLKEQPADSGIVQVGANVVVGHFSQTHEHLNLELPVFEYLQKVILKEVPGAAMSEQAARDLAGAFMFSGQDQDRPLKQMSGGERARAVLAGLLASAKNLLVLDEPTNHLDIPAAERLELALAMPDEDDDQGFEGTLILISHDRALIDATCDHLLILDGQGNAETFVGTYTEWKEKDTLRKREAARAEADAKDKRERADAQRLAQRQAAAAAKQAEQHSKTATKASSFNNPLSKVKTEQLVEKIARLEARIKEIDMALADADTWRDPAKCDKLGKERAKLATELEPLEFEYFSRG
jgi:ATP-binding cassette subfamily F protein 3